MAFHENYVIKQQTVVTAVTVTNSATALPTTALAGRRTVIIQNTSTTPIYLGPSTVTATTGIALATQYASLQLDLGSGVVLYGITATGSASVIVFEAA